MLINVEKVKQLYQQAQDYKTDIKEDYNATYELTDPFFKINDSGKREKNQKRKIDSTVLVSIRFLTNYIMTSLFSRSGTWAVLRTNPLAYKEFTGTDGEVAEGTIQELNALMQRNSDTVYQFNETTNYYTETAKAIKDCFNVGTGVRKTVELASRTKPFTYEYVSLDNFYFLEDAFGKPTITFKVYTEKNLSQLNDMFGHIQGFKAPSDLTDEEDVKKTVNVIECVIPNYQESTSETEFYHCLYLENFEETLFERVIKRNPFRVFRWGTDSSNPWGVGISRENKDLLQDLEDYKKKEATMQI